VAVNTEGKAQELSIPAKPAGQGSAVNGGELLFLALATCYCNDVYREAAKRGMHVGRVNVEVWGDFGAEGEPARNVSYRAKVKAHATDAEIRSLMMEVDRLAEIQNTVRVETPVTLEGVEAEEAESEN
jgi:organic hydroperoxide reductase OsmC/OhrA